MSTIDTLARKIVDLERSITASHTPQLAFSSVEVDGTEIGVVDNMRETVSLRVDLTEANAILEQAVLDLEAAKGDLATIPADVAAAKQEAIDAAALTAQQKADLAEAAALAAANGYTDTAKQAAIAAAATDAQQKADAAEQAAIDAAALTAQAKADAAKAAALTEAAVTAEEKAEAAAATAKAEALAAAATDATNKANTAKSEAIAAAATDATTKANTAKTEAISAAATTAQQKADTAKQAAIDAAAITAQAKADQAKADALTAAATTAQQKADAAKAQAVADATAAAATTAQQKADLAEAQAIASAKSYAQSRGTDLVTNGTAFLGDNTNFSAFDYRGDDSPVGASGSFRDKSTAARGVMMDELIPYDASKAFRFAFQMRQTVAGATNRAYGMVVPYDTDGWQIAPVNYMYIAGTMTTLAAPLNPGDTTIKLTNSAGWYGSATKPAGAAPHLRTAQFWRYTDGKGKTWAPGTYTQYVTPYGAWNDGGLNSATHTITLNAPWAGPVHPAGTTVSNGTSGGSYVYTPSLVNGVIPETWTAYGDTLAAGAMPPSQYAVATSGAATWATGLPVATAKIKLGWLLNYAPSPANAIVGRHAVAAVSFSDAAAAAYAAHNITETQITNDAITTPKIKANNVVAAHVASDAILARHIKALEIVAGHIATDAILARHIKAEQIEAGKLAANSVKAVNIIAEAVTAEKIKALAITADKIAALQITTEKLAAFAVTADKIEANAITAEKIMADAIDGMTITGANIRTAASGTRLELSSTNYNMLRTYSGLAEEIAPGGIMADATRNGSITLQGSDIGQGHAFLHVGTDENVIDGIPMLTNTVWTNSDNAHISASLRTLLTGGESSLSIEDGSPDTGQGELASIAMYAKHKLQMQGESFSLYGYDLAQDGDASIAGYAHGLYLGHRKGAKESQVSIDTFGLSLFSDSIVLNGDDITLDGPTTFAGTISAPAMSAAYVQGAGAYVSTGAYNGDWPGASGHSVDFVAPPSGRVKITVSAFIKAGVDGAATTLQFRIANVSNGTPGATFRPANVNEGLANYNVQYVKAEKSTLVDGLVPGGTYKAVANIYTTGAGAAWSNGSILVEPGL